MYYIICSYSKCVLISTAGYKVVAINTDVDANVFAKKGKKDPTKTLPSPLDLNSLHEVCLLLILHTILTRCITYEWC